MSCNCYQNKNKCQSKPYSPNGVTCPTIPGNACCKGLTPPKFNVAKATTICAYVDRIFDERVGVGSALFHALTTDNKEYVTTIVLTNQNPMCCTPCALENTSTFDISDCKISKLFSLKPKGEISAENVFVNGKPVKSVTDNMDGTYTIVLSPTNGVPAEDCKEAGLGTKSTLLMKDIGKPWDYTASHELFGVVNTNGQSCDFKYKVEDLPPNTGTTDTETSSFMVQEICIPSETSTIKFSFDGIVTLVSPKLEFSSESNFVTLQSTVVISPKINVEIIEKTRVCFQAMIDGEVNNGVNNKNCKCGC